MAKKQLNKNLVVFLTLSAFLMMVIASVLMLRQLQSRDPVYYTELARRYEGDGDWETAALFYREAWERSDDATHLVAHGEMWLNDGEVGKALQSWRTALINQPDLIEAHIRQLGLLLELARLYGRIEDWELVQEAAQTLLDTAAEKTPAQAALAHNANGLALLNLVRRDAGNARRGEAELGIAVELAKDSADYALDLASYYIRQNRAEEGERIYGELIERHTSPGAEAAIVRLAYAGYLAFQLRLDEAEAYFHQSLTLAEDEPTVLLDAKLGYAVFLSQQWARAARDNPDDEATQALFEEAEAVLRECIQADPEDFDPYLHLAVLYKSARRHKDVIELCESRLQRGFSRKGTEGPRNRINTFSLMIQASEACVAEAVAVHQAGDQNRRETYLTRAEQYVADARGEFPSHPRVHTQAGRVKLARGLDRAALEDFRAAEEAYRSYDAVNWENKLILARLHLKLNEAGAAKAVLEEVIDAARQERSHDANFWTLYAQVLFQNNEFDGALAISDQILAADPDNNGALRLKAAVYERKGRREEAGRLVGDRVVRAILTARQLSLEGGVEGAIAVLRDALEKDPADPRLVGAAVRELSSAERMEEARAIVDAALTVEPDDLQLQRLSVVTREDLSPDERDRAMLEIIETVQDPYERTLALVGFYLRKEDLPKALELIDQALEHLIAKDTAVAQSATIAQHRALLNAKLSVAAGMDDTETLEAAREAAERYNVDGAGGKSVLGLYHMHRKEYGLAVNAFRQAVAAQPTDARSLTHLGQSLQMLGRIEEAKRAYQRAIQVNPNAGDAHKGLATLAKARGDTEAYEQALATCQRLIPYDPWVQAEILLRQEQADPQTAIARREKLLDANPDDIQNLHRLATLCEAANDPAKADDYYARLLDLRPDDKDLMVAVSRYYRRTGRIERSLQLVTQYAQSRSTPEQKANAHILIAAHHLSQGDLDAVEDTLLTAADIAETLEVTQSLAEFYLRSADRPDKALPWLDKAIAQARSAQSPILPRILAARASCLLHRKLNDIQAARQTVEELLATFPDHAPGLLLSSEVHARTGEIEEAIDSLSEYLARMPNDPYALYQRALHQSARGRVGAAVEDLETIKRTNPLALNLEPRFLLARLRQLAGHEDLWLRELESLAQDAPDSAKALEELARAYIQEERFADAERIVTAQINRAGEKPDARWFYLRGQISLTLDDRAEALSDFSRGAQISGYTAEAVTRVLDMYLRLDRPAEGVQYYQTHAPSDQSAPTLLSRYALLLAKADQKAEAVRQFRRAMNLAMLDSSEVRRIVTADLRAGFPIDEAIALFEGSQTDPAMARANDQILAQLYVMAERYGDATAKLKRLLESSTDNSERADLLHELGDLHQVAGNPAGARLAYEEALRYNDDNWITLNNLAYVLSDGLGEHELARPYAERAVTIADRSATLDTLGWIYVGLGEYSLAVAELSRAIRLNPGDPLTYYHLGEANRRNGQFEEAANILKSGQDLARSSGRTEMVTRFEVSLQQIERSDRTP